MGGWHPDPLFVEFIREYCDFVPGACVSKIWLWNRYVNFAIGKSGKKMTFYDEKGFDELMKEMGVASEENEYLGIRIRKKEKELMIASPGNNSRRAEGKPASL
jgi:hypothetical protein